MGNDLSAYLSKKCIFRYYIDKYEDKIVMSNRVSMKPRP